MKTLNGNTLRATRTKLGQDQACFWARFGVTQSGGSRYEGGRRIPRPLQKLLAIGLGSERQAGRVVQTLRQRRER